MNKILSYLTPIKMKTYTSKISGPLEVTYLNGKKVLDAANVNYSYGALQRVLHEGLRHINFGDHIKKVLVLGMGGGSIVESLRSDFNSRAEIRLVEIDPEIIRIAKEEFDVEAYENMEIIEADAFEYVKENTQEFDLVVVDLFIGDNIPAEFTQSEFLKALPKLLAPQGQLIFNTMRRSLEVGVRDCMVSILEEQGLQITVLEKVADYNDLICGRLI